ncbi:MAG TPA: DNA polymerase III subunit beta [Streptosporangiaceae bacterium]
MKFRVGREALGEAVGWVARALPARPVVPVLSGLLLDAGEDGLTLSCFDYEVAARIQVEAEVLEAGTALVPGRLLAEITRSLPARPVQFSSDNSDVDMTCGSAEFTLVSLPAEDYPALPEPPQPAGTVESTALATAVSQVVPAASRDDTLPMLTAVCLDVDGETLTLAATDRYRLAVRELRWQPATPGIRAVAMVPARTLADFARTMTPGVPVTISFGVGEGAAPGQAAREPRPADGMISFEADRRRLIARLIGGEFIRYRSRFPDEFGCQAELPAGPVIEAVRRVSLVAERASPVRLSFGAGQVVIEARAEGRARAVETVAAQFSGTEPVISFNPHYLLDGLTAAAASGPARLPAGDAAEPGAGHGGEPAGSGRIRLEFTSPAKPALITWARRAAHGDGDGHGDGHGDDQDDGGRDDGDRGADADGPPPFRYLLVPLRVPARA